MGTAVVIVVVVVIIFAIFFVVWQRSSARKERQSAQLRDQFGPEYDRAVREYGSADTAESALQTRAERVDQLDIRALTPDERSRFSTAWTECQARFVDDPAGAVEEADALVAQVMEARNYPVGDFDQQASNVSVNYPDVVENYRAAHRIALRQQEGQASTEDLRQAMVHYRALFQNLLETPEGTAGQPHQ